MSVGSSLARSNVAQPAPLTAPVQSGAVPDNFALAPMLEAHRGRLETMLPDGVEYKQFMVELYHATRKQPDLLNAHPDDLVPALCDALDTGGKIGQDVYLLTFKSSKKSTPDVTVALDYKFKVELVVRAGGAKAIDAFPVYEKEPFQMELGSSPFVRHQPLPASKRGALKGAYAVAQLGHGVVKIQWCDVEMIEKLRARSKSWNDEMLRRKGEPAGCPEWYGPKTAVHRVVKLLPKNPKLTRILGRIDQEERDEFGDPLEVSPTSNEAGTGPETGNSQQRNAGPETPAASAPSQPATPAPAQESFDLGLDVDADEDEGSGPVVLTLEQAVEVKYQNRPLYTLRSSSLRKIEEGARAKIDEEGEGSQYVVLAAACRAILEARERGEAAEPKAENVNPKKPF